MINISEENLKLLREGKLGIRSDLRCTEEERQLLWNVMTLIDPNASKLYLKNRDKYFFYRTIPWPQWNGSRLKPNFKETEFIKLEDLIISKKPKKEFDLFDNDYLDSIGFKVVKDDGQYGEAIDKRSNGMTVMNWNRQGHSVTYFGDSLEKNGAMSLKKDGGTRTAFSGYVFSREHIELIIKLTL